VRAARPRLRSLLRPLVSGYAIAAVLASPLLLYAAVGFESGAINEPSRFGSDLLNLVVPTRLIGIGGAYLADVSSRFPANDAERGAYLGLPTLVMVVWFAVRRRGSPVARFLVVALALSALVELGTSLVVDGLRLVALPWDLIARLPLLNNVLPGRFALFTSLAAAVIVALWIQSSRGLVAYALPALGVLALVPAVWKADFRSVPERWPFFTDGLYKTCLQRDENVLVFPYGPRGSSMLWQAESGFWFRMAEGYLRPKPPAAFLEHPTVQKLTYTADDPTPEEILSLARDKKVSRVLSVERYQHPSNDEMKRFGALQVVGGVAVAPACGNPPLAG
jgi:hypothetical protein